MIKIIVILCCLTFVFVSAKSQYRVTKVEKNTTSVLLILTYTGKDQYFVKPTSPIIQHLTFMFHTHAFNDFLVKITDADKHRFEVPQGGSFPADPLANFSFPLAAASVSLTYTEDPFDFKITRKQNGAVLFSTYDRDFIFSEHYLEIGTEVQSQYLYGLGERFVQNFRVQDGKWTMFTREQGFTMDYGEGKNAYGYYPFYLMRQRDNLFHINYFRSSNAMDVFKETTGSKHYLIYKVIGGIFDFRFFLSEQSPEATVEKFNFYSGQAPIPPFWSLGFHQSRWGYQNISFLTDVIQNYRKYDIPLDAIWSDIDYLLELQDFTIDEDRFPIEEMRAIMENYRWVPIIDAGIKNSGPSYEEGLKRGVYTQQPSGKSFIGKVWPGDTAFVDFFHPNATQYWIDMLNVLYQKLPFDGLWLDMNEIDNFCNGPCHVPTDPSIFDYSRDLPYQPGNDSIETKTIPLNCTHYGNKTQANVHVFNGHLTTFSSNMFFKSKGVRPFIITRSSTVGTSRYGFHWTGDNFADWSFLRESIPHILNCQMFGFQMVGADICGFGGDASEQLCARWYQLGALYPFSRSHNILGTVSQQPYAMGPAVLQASTKAIRLRYSLLKHIYTLFVSQLGLGVLWKPLFFDYPLDSNCYQDIVVNSEFLIGRELMVAPILQQGQTSRTIYFPSFFYEFHTGTRHAPGSSLVSGYQLTGIIPLFLREGSLVLVQDVKSVASTKELNNQFTIKAGFSLNKKISNETYQLYEASGTILSLSDYGQDSKVDLCLRDKCHYHFELALTAVGQKRMLEIDVTYVGPPSLKEPVVITGLTLFISGEVLSLKLNLPVRITGAIKTFIEISVEDFGKAQVSLQTV